jgi:serine/threonine protein kinase
MEYVAGGGLDRQLAAGPLPPGEATHLVAAVARGIHAAHERGIVHRDLKPGNILVSDGVVSAGVVGGDTTHQAPRTTHQYKIADFGLAKHLEDAESLTASGAIIGTPHYMAPEQAEGRARDVGPAADIYSLGAILYQALSGQPPFQGPSIPAVLEMVRSQAPVPLRQVRPELPADLELVCATCLDKDPRRRYSSARALAEELERLQECLDLEWHAVKPIHETPPTAQVPKPATRAHAGPRQTARARPQWAPGLCASVAGAAVNLLALGAGWILFLAQRLRARKAEAGVPPTSQNRPPSRP